MEDSLGGYNNNNIQPEASIRKRQPPSAPPPSLPPPPSSLFTPSNPSSSSSSRSRATGKENQNPNYPTTNGVAGPPPPSPTAATGRSAMAPLGPQAAPFVHPVPPSPSSSPSSTNPPPPLAVANQKAVAQELSQVLASSQKFRTVLETGGNVVNSEVSILVSNMKELHNERLKNDEIYEQQRYEEKQAHLQELKVRDEEWKSRLDSYFGSIDLLKEENKTLWARLNQTLIASEASIGKRKQLDDAYIEEQQEAKRIRSEPPQQQLQQQQQRRSPPRQIPPQQPPQQPSQSQYLQQPIPQQPQYHHHHHQHPAAPPPQQPQQYPLIFPPSPSPLDNQDMRDQVHQYAADAASALGIGDKDTDEDISAVNDAYNIFNTYQPR